MIVTLPEFEENICFPGSLWLHLCLQTTKLSVQWTVFQKLPGPFTGLKAPKDGLYSALWLGK